LQKTPQPACNPNQTLNKKNNISLNPLVDVVLREFSATTTIENKPFTVTFIIGNALDVVQEVEK